MLNFEFQNPWVLLLLLALPFSFLEKFVKQVKKASLKLPSLNAFGGAKVH